MMVADAPEKERKNILNEAHEQAALHTDDYWTYMECATVDELYLQMESVDRADLFCLDITMKDGLDAAEKMRSAYPEAYVILVADQSVSPVSYMRPSIRAESLMLRPLSDVHIRSILGEAVSVYAKRLGEPDREAFFVVENRGAQELVPYGRILFFESREKKVYLSTETEEYGFYDTLDELAKQLAQSFLRVHRSFLVNTEQIERVEISASRVILRDGTQIPVSRTCKPGLRAWMEDKKEGSRHGENSRKDMAAILR